MYLICRAFEQESNDFERMWQFIVDDYANRKERFIWTIGRLGDWKYGLWQERKYFPSFMRQNAQLWLDHRNEIAGMVIAENCDAYFTVFARRGYEFLYTEMLQWVKAHWGSREGALQTDAHDNHHLYLEALEQEGFRKTHLAAVTRQFDVKQAAQKAIPELGEGTTIVTMHEHPDYKGKVELGINAWNGRTDGVQLLDWLQYEYNRENPCYSPAMDFSVMDREGRHLASCVAFVDYKNNYAEIEKICTHSDYRRRGLAEAVIRACFRKLKEQGIEHAYLTGMGPEAQALYGKFGAAKEMHIYGYSL